MACFVDDLITFSNTYYQHLQDLDEVITILENLGLTLKARKTFLGFKSLELLGYLVDRLGLTTTEEKARALREIALPTTLQQLEYFVGLTNWNRHLIPLYACRMSYLQEIKTALLARGPTGGQARKGYADKTKISEHYDTTPDSSYAQAFSDVRDELTARPALHHFDPAKVLYLFVDASKEMGMDAAAD